MAQCGWVGYLALQTSDCLHTASCRGPAIKIQVNLQFVCVTLPNSHAPTQSFLQLLQGTLLGLLTASGAELSILQSANRVVAAGARQGRAVGGGDLLLA